MSLQVAILTISDRSSSGERPDSSGPALAGVVHSQGWSASFVEVIPDDFAVIQHTLTGWCDSGDLDVILTTGGTGFGPRDVTPEATQAVLERPAPGIAEAMRLAGLQVTPHAMLSRGVCGIRGRTLIINLPGSPKGAVESLQVVLPVLPHAVALLQGDPGAEAGHSRI